MTIADLLPFQTFILNRSQDKYIYIDDGRKKTTHKVRDIKKNKRIYLDHQCRVTLCE